MGFFKRIFDRIKNTLSNYINPKHKQQENKSFTDFEHEIKYVKAKDYEKKFLSNYSYVIKYTTKAGEPKFITISSAKKLDYMDVMDKALKVIKFGYDETDPEHYGEDIDYSSLEIIIGVENI